MENKQISVKIRQMLRQSLRLSEGHIIHGDFSLAIPKLVAKIEFLADSFLNAYEHKSFAPDRSFYWGVSAILTEVAEDLDIIGEALYPSVNN